MGMNGRVAKSYLDPAKMQVGQLDRFPEIHSGQIAQIMQSGNSDYLVVDDHVNNLTRFINGFLRLSSEFRNEFILDTYSGGGA